MPQVPAEAGAIFEQRLDEAQVPAPQRPDYRKWVRFYLDFCHKYAHPAAFPTSLGLFLTKLPSKNQSVAQRTQASAAVGLLLQPGAALGAADSWLTATLARTPRAPLNSQPPALPGCGEAGFSAVSQVPPAPPPTPKTAPPPARPPPAQRELPEPSSTRPPDWPAAPLPDTAVSGAPSARPAAPGRGASWQQEYRNLEAAILLRNYSTRTLEAYRFWIGKFQTFVRSRPTAELGTQEVRGFLSDLAVRRRVAASTQNQAVKKVES